MIRCPEIDSGQKKSSCLPRASALGPGVPDCPPGFFGHSSPFSSGSIEALVREGVKEKTRVELMK